MTNADFVFVLSQLAGAYALGWCSAFLMRVFTQALEKL